MPIPQSMESIRPYHMSNALEAAKRQWEQTLDSLPFPMVLADLNGCVLRGNLAVTEGDRNRIRTLPGRLLHSDLRAVSQQVAEENRAVRQRMEHVRVLDDGCDGQWLDPVREAVELFSTPILNPSGDVFMVAHYLIDRSMEWELERQLRQMQRMSEVGMLASGIAHNLNNPLQVLQGQIQLIELKREGGDSRVSAEELARLNQQVGRMTDIVTNLMMRLRSDQASRPILVDVNELLRRDLSLLEADPFYKHHVRKELQFDPDLPQLECIPAELSQAVMNLVNNSMDAMRDVKRKVLRVRTRCTFGGAILEVEDTGIGIPDDLREKIFDPFFTTKAPLSERGAGQVTGTGLGLSSTLYLLQRAGVSLELDSLPGKGTCFSLAWRED